MTASNTRGILLMTLSMLAFSSQDFVIKYLTQSLPVGQLLITIGVLSSLVFLGMCVAKKINPFARSYWTPRLILRAVLEGATGLCLASAIALIDLANVVAIYQTTPMVVIFLAVIFLKEQASWRSWVAIFIGFVGVLFIVRPGLEGFEMPSLLVLGAVGFAACHDLITRVLPNTIPSEVISFQSMAISLPSGLLLLAITGDQLAAVTNPLPLIGFALLTALAYYLIVEAIRAAKDTSAVMPFRYVRLIFSMIGSALLFREYPDLSTLIGAGLILASGLYILLKES